MRYLKLGLVALVVAIAAIGLLRITDVITPAQVPWLATRAAVGILLVMVASIALGAIAQRPAPDESADRPIP